MAFTKGNSPWNRGKKGLQIAWNKGKKLPENLGSGNPNWKGNKELDYKYAHDLINKLYGKPRFCEECKRKDRKRYEWANITKIYNREKKNWKRLCKSCHLAFDKVMEKRKRGKDGKFI